METCSCANLLQKHLDRLSVVLCRGLLFSFGLLGAVILAAIDTYVAPLLLLLCRGLLFGLGF